MAKFPPLKLGDLPIERCPFFGNKDGIKKFSSLWELLKGTSWIWFHLQNHSDYKGFGEIIFQFKYSVSNKEQSFELLQTLKSEVIQMGYFPLVLESDHEVRLQIWPNARAVEAMKERDEMLRKGGKESRWDD
jgi:hypothetical protein